MLRGQQSNSDWLQQRERLLESPREISVSQAEVWVSDSAVPGSAWLLQASLLAKGQGWSLIGQD